MENEIITFFDTVQMPAGCSRRISSTIDARISAPKHKEVYTMRQGEASSRFGWIGAAACLAVLLFTAGWFFDRTIPAQVTEPSQVLSADTDWLAQEDGRVFLTMADPRIDVTEMLSAEEPVIFCWITPENVVKFYALGWNRTQTDLGWFYNEYREETGWAEGSAWNHLDADGEACGWYAAAVEKMEAHRIRVTEELTGTALPFVSYKQTVRDCINGILPQWLEERNGKLYFVWEGSRIDISEAFSEEKPFLYSSVDDSGLETIIAIGGTYVPGTNLEGVGWAEFLRDVLLAENLARKDVSWKGGYCYRTSDQETGENFGWFNVVLEHYDWPYS